MSDSFTADCPINASTEERSQLYEIGYIVYYTTFIILTAAVCLIGNILVIRYIWNTKRKHLSPCSYMIFSLACSDVTSGVIYPMYNMFQISYIDTVTEEGCKWVIFLTCATQTISSYCLVGLTIIRFIAVLKPHFYQQWLFISCYRRLLIFSIVTIWLWGIFICFILYVGLYDRQEHTGNKCRYEMQYGFYHAVIGFCTVTLTSVVVMVAVYVAMVYVYKKQARSIGVQHKTQNPGNTPKPEPNLGQSAGVLIGTYVVTWCPVWIYALLYTLCVERHMECPEYCEQLDMPFLRATFNILAFVNSAINVFIYSGTNAKFRRALKRDALKLLNCLCLCQRNMFKGSKGSMDSDEGTTKCSAASGVRRKLSRTLSRNK